MVSRPKPGLDPPFGSDWESGCDKNDPQEDKTTKAILRNIQRCFERGKS